MNDTAGGEVRSVVRHRWTEEGPAEPEVITIGTLGPEAEAARRRFLVHELGGLDPTALDHLAIALGMASAAVPVLGAEEAADDSVLLELTDELVDQLAGCSPEELRAAGERWVELWAADLATIPAYEGSVPPEAVPRLDGPGGWGPALSDLAGLAARAREAGWAMMVRFAL
jgi:hypothetical protein